MSLVLNKTYFLCFVMTIVSHSMWAQISPVIRALENDEDVNVKKTRLSGRYDEISPAFNYADNYMYYVLGTGQSVRTSKKNNISVKGTLDVWRVSFNEKLELGEPEKVGGEINSSANDGPVCFYEGGKKMLITRNALFNKKTQSFENQDSKMFFIPLQLFSMELIEGEWKNIKLLDINKPRYSYTHPTVSPNGKKLIFSSNNPNSYGNHDLFLSKLVDGEWSKPKNLGKKINSKQQEVFPYFIDDDNIIFSSNSDDDSDDLDIYLTNINDPETKRLPSPINSKGDDFGVAIYKDKRHWLISSNRKKANGMDDIFIIWVDEPTPKESPLLEDSKGTKISTSVIEWGFPIEYKSISDTPIGYKSLLNHYNYEKPATNQIYIENSIDKVKNEDILKLKIPKSNLSKGDKVILGPFYNIFTVEKKRQELIMMGYINSKIYFYHNNERMDVSKVKELLMKNQ